MKMGRWKGGLCRWKADVRRKWTAGKVACVAGKPSCDKHGPLERWPVSLESRRAMKMERWKGGLLRWKADLRQKWAAGNGGLHRWKADVR